MERIERFIEGFSRFQHHYYQECPELFRSLSEGQTPSTLLIGCCDSRVDPSLLLGCDPGDLFIMRNVANLVPPISESVGPQGVLAAIEFAVQVLLVQRVIVLGHSQCGGIRHLMQRPQHLQEQEPSMQSDGASLLQRWMDIAEPARMQVLRHLPGASQAEQRRACEQASILISLHNLSAMPAVMKRLEQGDLSLHGWYFDLASGSLHAYSPRADAFLPVCDQHSPDVFSHHHPL